MPITFDVNYYKGDGSFSHKYSETWERTDWYCPKCGERKVWHDTSGGDYYVGEMHLCMGCHSSFYLPSLHEVNVNDKQTTQRCHEIQKVLE